MNIPKTISIKRAITPIKPIMIEILIMILKIPAILFSFFLLNKK